MKESDKLRELTDKFEIEKTRKTPRPEILEDISIDIILMLLKYVNQIPF